MFSGLIFILLLLILVDLEVAQLVALLGVGYNPQPVPEVVLFQIFLGEILQVPERDQGGGSMILLMCTNGFIKRKATPTGRQMHRIKASALLFQCYWLADE